MIENKHFCTFDLFVSIPKAICKTGFRLSELMTACPESQLWPGFSARAECILEARQRTVPWVLRVSTLAGLLWSWEHTTKTTSNG